ncbi:type II toxin-antitoxin system RelB/DinJ family antitoxin [Corynebacterium poyangense]|uniref:Type II toxin-antitoxin system RelB/DinJ family antitoxin n=1 Tax=Corynebacterium poyangense TaxID=2684405 RepID=A0A7H0SR19_9CORY|nr:type II toxin-antitoxin system RelB/DinJ family antitoxin [Corynebacterium poyangense]QNQ90994.1 type II toxin-antitoxin system RelB/DinJ family antitoxin [Corynebacterium poyangense]
MGQATFSVRMDEELKRQFDELCREFGMNATTAFNVFARAVVRERKIPFEISAQNTDDAIRTSGSTAFNALRMQAAQNGLSDMSLEEINREIQKTRQGV